MVGGKKGKKGKKDLAGVGISKVSGPFMTSQRIDFPELSVSESSFGKMEQAKEGKCGLFFILITGTITDTLETRIMKTVQK